MRMHSEYQSTLNLLIRAMATSITLGMLALAQESDSLLERVAPFWRIGAGFETRLMLNNTQAAPRIVRFEVFDSSGRRIPARELTLGPLESTEVDLGDLTGGRNGYGQISLRHDGRPLEVAAHVMVMHRGRGLVFDEHFQMRSQFLGSRLVGTSDLGVNSAASLLVVANTGGERRRVTVQAVSGGRRGTMNLTLGPHETQTVPFGALFREPESAGRNPSDTAVAIEVEHDGARGEVLVQGLLMGPQGLAANMRIADRAKLVSRRALSPVLRLHPGQRSRLALYNLGSAPLSVSPVVRYRTGKFVGRLPLAPLALAAREVRGDELTAALAALPPGAEDLGLSLEYEGAPGSLVAEVLMIDPRSGNVVPASPKDVEGEGSAGMTFAWRLHDTSSTVIALANPSADKEIPVQLILFFDGKTYALGGVGSLQPGEVRHFDIRRLRDEQVPGQGGVLIPPGVMKGQAKAIVRNELGQNYKILGQAISVGTQGPTPGSLGCALCPPDPSHVVLSPGSFTGNVGTNQQIYPWIYWSDQSSFINNNPYAIDWYPANSSVATVSEAWYNFRVQFLSPGTTTIDATMPNECHYEYDWFYGSCVCSYYLPVWALAPAQVTAKREFTVTTRAFIMPNNVGPDPYSCAGSGGVYYKGDERSFSASAWSFRTQQQVIYRSDPGGSIVSHSPSVGPSRSYAKNAIDNNGQIGPEDEDGVPNDCSLWHQADQASTSGMNATKSAGNGVRMYGAAANPLNDWLDIDWDYTINFSLANPSQPTYSLTVTHDCFPAHEAYIGSQAVYTFTPAASSMFQIGTCLAGFGQITAVRSGGVQ